MVRIECVRECDARVSGLARICIRVNIPPILGKNVIVKESPHNKDRKEHFVNFTIQYDCAERFVKALIRRGLVSPLSILIVHRGALIMNHFKE